MKGIDQFFEYAGLVLLFTNTCLFFKSYAFHKKNTALRIFSVYLLLTFLVLFGSFLLALYKINNLYLSHFYFIIQFILLSLFYKALFTKMQRIWVKIILISVLITLGIQYACQPGLYYTFNTLEVFLTSFPLVVYSIVHLYNSLNKSGELMYINAGILVYLATSTLIFILGDYLSGFNNEIVKNIWFLNKVLYAGYLILILLEWKKNLRPDRNR